MPPLSTPTPKHITREKDVAAVAPWWQGLRHQGSRGGTIEPHRSLATVSITRRNLVFSALLTVSLTIVWLALMNTVTMWWEKFIAVWMPLLGLTGGVTRYALPFSVAGQKIRVLVPSVAVTASTPDGNTWFGCLVGVLLVLLCAQLMMKRFLPAAYLLRWIALIQCTALVFFALYPASFIYTLPQYLTGLLLANLTIISIVPLVLGLTYYIFNFHLLKKIGLTLCIMGHLIIFAPLQFLVHAYVIHGSSLLFMPLFHFLFGIPLLILIFVSFYAWGMSWNEQPGSRC